jgi:hypothetical protein
MAYLKMPRSVEDRGNLTVYMGSPEHKRKLKRLLELTGAASASAAIYQAIDFYLRAHDSPPARGPKGAEAGKKKKRKKGLGG